MSRCRNAEAVTNNNTIEPLFAAAVQLDAGNKCSTCLELACDRDVELQQEPL